MRFLRYLFIGELSLKRIVRSAILIPIVSVVGLLVYGYMFADRIIFQPPPVGYRDTSEFLKLTTADGTRISAVYLPDPSSTYTILYSHGNAEDLGTVSHKLLALHAMGFSVLGYDYHGYGKSEGRPSEKAAYEDIDAAYDYLTGELHIPPEHIILHGWSLGGAVAADLASRRPVGGLILESTFVSAFRVVTGVSVPFDWFKTLDKIKNVTCPILIIHGRDDRVVKFWHGEKLYQSANEPKQFLWVDNAGHGDISYVAGEQYEQAIKKFVTQIQSSAKILP